MYIRISIVNYNYNGIVTFSYITKMKLALLVSKIKLKPF